MTGARRNRREVEMEIKTFSRKAKAAEIMKKKRRDATKRNFESNLRVVLHLHKKGMRALIKLSNIGQHSVGIDAKEINTARKANSKLGNGLNTKSGRCCQQLPKFDDDLHAQCIRQDI